MWGDPRGMLTRESCWRPPLRLCYCIFNYTERNCRVRLILYIIIYCYSNLNIGRPWASGIYHALTSLLLLILAPHVIAINPTESTHSHSEPHSFSESLTCLRKIHKSKLHKYTSIIFNKWFGFQIELHTYFYPFSEHLSDHNSLHFPLIQKCLRHFTPR